MASPSQESFLLLSALLRIAALLVVSWGRNAPLTTPRVYNCSMAKVSLAKALKLKNKQIKIVKGLQEQVAKYNSVVKGSDNPFDVKAKFEESKAAGLKLAQIKAAIQTANVPIQQQIFEMAELRGLLAFLQRLETKSGKGVFGYQTEIVDFEASLTALDVERETESIEERLEELQDEVDAFNVNTMVELPD